VKAGTVRSAPTTLRALPLSLASSLFYARRAGINSYICLHVLRAHLTRASPQSKVIATTFRDGLAIAATSSGIQSAKALHGSLKRIHETHYANPIPNLTHVSRGASKICLILVKIESTSLLLTLAR
jgi:hypothetical protein